MCPGPLYRCPRVGPMLAGPVPRVRGPTLTAAAPATHITLLGQQKGCSWVRPSLRTSLRMRQYSSRLFLRPQNEAGERLSQCLGAQRWAEPSCDRVSHFSRQARASEALGSCAVRAGWEMVCCMCARTSIAPRRKQSTARVEAGEEVESRTSHGASQPLCTLSTHAAQRDRDEGDGSQCPTKCKAVFLHTKAERQRLRV